VLAATSSGREESNKMWNAPKKKTARGNSTKSKRERGINYIW